MYCFGVKTYLRRRRPAQSWLSKQQTTDNAQRRWLGVTQMRFAETGAYGTPPMVMVTSGIESSLEQSTVDSPSGDGSSVHACQRRATGDGMHGRE